MSDNIATARSLHEEYGRKQCWEEQQEPIVSFCCDDGAICGFPFLHLSVARLTDDLLSLQWPGAVIEIRGPLAGEFYKDFAKHRGTWIKADGESIVSVKMFILPNKPRWAKYCFFRFDLDCRSSPVIRGC